MKAALLIFGVLTLGMTAGLVIPVPVKHDLGGVGAVELSGIKMSDMLAVGRDRATRKLEITEANELKELDQLLQVIVWRRFFELNSHEGWAEFYTLRFVRNGKEERIGFSETEWTPGGRTPPRCLHGPERRLPKCQSRRPTACLIVDAGCRKMTEAYSELSTGFSTADTVGPIAVCFSGEVLHVDFEGVDGKKRRVLFSNVRAFAWSGWDATSPDASPDRIYQVRGSSLLAPWENVRVGEQRFVHYKLGFNAEGKYLDVVATSMCQKEPIQPAQPTPES